MLRVSKCLPVIFVVVLAGAVVIAGDAFGVNITLLNEHFDKDQRIPALAWPWNTPPQNPNIRWHWNPRTPHRRAELNTTDYCWGLQDFIFNTYVLQDEEFPASIWCAYTNQSNVNNPRWPEDDDYMNNQCAWVWWGPMDLTHANAAGVQFWTYVNMTNYNYDSLSVVLTDDYNNITIEVPINDEAQRQRVFRTSLKFGMLRDGNGDEAGLCVFNRGVNDWVNRSFQFDDLRTLNNAGEIIGEASFLGHRNVWIAWVWHSNRSGIAGKGAFIDDIVIQMDDGRFDFEAAAAWYGYRIEEDSIYWCAVPPTYLEPTYLRFDWYARGTGQSPQFNIACLLDGDVIYAENRQVEGSSEAYRTVIPNPWIAAEGDHRILWKLDADSTVDEAVETNNELELLLSIPWTPPPSLSIFTPERDSTEVPLDVPFDLRVAVSDSNDTDTTFTLFLYVAEDTVGLRGNINEFEDLPVAVFDFRARAGECSYSFRPQNVDGMELDRLYYVVGLCSDGVVGNTTIAFAPGRIWVRPLGVNDGSASTPDAFALKAPFPNPFNSETILSFALPVRSGATLAIYNLAGRQVALLASGVYEAGDHSFTWRAAGVGAGVYLARLEAGGKTFVRKLVFCQ